MFVANEGKAEIGAAEAENGGHIQDRHARLTNGMERVQVGILGKEQVHHPVIRVGLSVLHPRDHLLDFQSRRWARRHMFLDQDQEALRDHLHLYSAEGQGV